MRTRLLATGLFDRLEAHPWPSIAVIDGPAYGGGCELTLACDLRIASPAARFAQPELGLGNQPLHGNRAQIQDLQLGQVGEQFGRGELAGDDRTPV